jgi:hypothetical protein
VQARLLGVEGVVRQVDLGEARHCEAGEHRRLRPDRIEVVVEEVELFFAELDRALLDV